MNDKNKNINVYPLELPSFAAVGNYAVYSTKYGLISIGGKNKNNFNILNFNINHDINNNNNQCQ